MSFNTYTSDSARGAQLVNLAGQAQAPAGIFLRHTTALSWCGAGGDWLGERRRAVRFNSNIDALVYCQAMGLRGVLVAFDDGGQEVYRLNVNTILDAVVTNPSVRSWFDSRQ